MTDSAEGWATFTWWRSVLWSVSNFQERTNAIFISWMVNLQFFPDQKPIRSVFWGCRWMILPRAKLNLCDGEVYFVAWIGTPNVDKCWLCYAYVDGECLLVNLLGTLWEESCAQGFLKAFIEKLNDIDADKDKTEIKVPQKFRDDTYIYIHIHNICIAINSLSDFSNRNEDMSISIWQNDWEVGEAVIKANIHCVCAVQLFAFSFSIPS